MINKLVCLTFIFVRFITLCIPRKDIIYLQNISKTTTNDQITQLESRLYRIQSGDILITIE